MVKPSIRESLREQQPLLAARSKSNNSVRFSQRVDERILAAVDTDDDDNNNNNDDCEDDHGEFHVKKPSSSSERHLDRSAMLPPDKNVPSSETKPLLRSSSSLSHIFNTFTRSERRQEALKQDGVGGAAFLIRDAVLGLKNQSAGTWWDLASFFVVLLLLLLLFFVCAVCVTFCFLS